MINKDKPSFSHQVFLVAGTVVLLALIWKLADVFVLVFGAIVVAVALRALIRKLERFGIPRRFSFVTALMLILLAIAGMVAWIGDPLAAQLSRLREGLPAALERMAAWMGSHRIGVTALEYWESLQDDGMPWGRLLGFAGTAIGAMGMFALIIFMGTFFAADPAMYKDGFLRLFPKSQRVAIAEALEQSADGLRRWLLGQSISMLYVGGATALGLAALGVPLALSIGLISGLLSFIPFLGALAGGSAGRAGRLHGRAHHGVARVDPLRRDPAGGRPCADSARAAMGCVAAAGVEPGVCARVRDPVRRCRRPVRDADDGRGDDPGAMSLRRARGAGDTGDRARAMMNLTSLVKKVARHLRLVRRPEEEPLTGLVAAIVSIERRAVSGDGLTIEDEEELLGRLTRAVESRAGGQLDGSERRVNDVQWFFFARDAHTLESVLLAEMRSEARFRGARLRVTSNGVVGPWRETSI